MDASSRKAAHPAPAPAKVETGFKRGFLNAPPSEKKKKPPPADDS